MIADGHVNGDPRSSDRLHQPEKLLVLGFCTHAERAVAIDDQVGRSGIECDDASCRLCQTIRHVHPFVLVLFVGRTGPFRARVGTIWIITDVRIGKQGNPVWIQPAMVPIRGGERSGCHQGRAAKSERTLDEITASDRC